MRLSYAVINPKLVSQSSILAHPPHVRWAWLALIIEGQLHDGVLPGLTAFQLSRLATISIQQAEESLRAFLAPDPFSACAANDGRRLELIEAETNTYRLVSFEFQQGLIRKARDAARKRAAYAESAGEKVETAETKRESPQNPPPLPTPLPTPQREESKASVRSPSGSRIPDDFPNEAAMEWACRVAGKAPSEATAIAENFRDYWLAKAGKDGRKADWMATWRGWVRREGSTPRGNGKAEKKIPFGGKRWNNDTQSFED